LHRSLVGDGWWPIGVTSGTVVVPSVSGNPGIQRITAYELFNAPGPWGETVPLFNNGSADLAYIGFVEHATITRITIYRLSKTFTKPQK